MKRIIPCLAKPPLCACGCGLPVKWRNNHWNYVVRGHYNKLPKMREQAVKRAKIIGQGNKGKIRSEEIRIILGKSHIGSHRNAVTKNKMSIARIRWHEKHPDSRKGSKNPNWTGGSSWEIYTQEWTTKLKNQIKKRDNYECQLPWCKGTDKILAIHHIDYIKRNCDSNNLITLCKACHAKTIPKPNHKKYQHLFIKLMKIKYEN